MTTSTSTARESAYAREQAAINQRARAEAAAYRASIGKPFTLAYLEEHGLA